MTPRKRKLNDVGNATRFASKNLEKVTKKCSTEYCKNSVEVTVNRRGQVNYCPICRQEINQTRDRNYYEANRSKISAKRKARYERLKQEDPKKWREIYITNKKKS